MPIARWQLALVEGFAVPLTVLKSLKKPVIKKLQEAVKKYLTFACDETKSEVLRVLGEHGIPSSLLQLEKFRLGHVRFVAAQERAELAAALQKEEAEEERQLGLALSVLREKFDLPSVSHVDRGKKQVAIGSDYLFCYCVRDNIVDWELIDRKTHCAVKIFSGDPSERLGSALNELYEQRMAWEREQAPDPRKAPKEDQSAVWEDPNPGTATDAPSDDESGRGTA